MLWKLDSDGNEKWSKIIGESDYDTVHSIISLTQGGFAICGRTQSFSGGDIDIYVMKIDEVGALDYTLSLGGTVDDAC